MLRLFTLALAMALFITSESIAQTSITNESIANNGYVKATLITSDVAEQPDGSFKVGIQFEMQDGWHIYWKNPGDAGLPTLINLSASTPIQTEEFETPAPIRFMLDDVVNYGFKDRVLYQTDAKLTDITDSDNSAQITANTTFLMCKETCIPGEFTLKKTLNANTTNLDVFENAEPIVAVVERVSASYMSSPAFKINIRSDNLPTEITSAYFIPEEDGLIEDSVKQDFSHISNDLTLSLTRDTFYNNEAPKTVSGTIIINESIMVEIDNVPLIRHMYHSEGDTGMSYPLIQDTDPAYSSTEFLIMILFALIAGIILNLMPCVLPVLSLKVMGLIHHAGQQNAYKYGIVYTLGSIFTFNVLATILSISINMGKGLGWGFQLQNPTFVAFLTIVMLLLILQIMGVFNFGQSFAKMDGLEKKTTYRSTFMSGMLMVILATPCTAPFMGSAIAFALTQSAAETYVIFTALGFGLALPYLLLTCSPNLLKKLPKPGPWENTLKEFFVFPLAATLTWLVWVFSNQTTSEVLYLLLLALFVITFMVWIREKATRKILASLALILVISLALERIHTSNQVDESQTESFSLQWNEWNQRSVNDTLNNGQNVFINFTADWCITCKINEKTTLTSNDTTDVFLQNNTKLFKADWTKYDKNITTALESYGRKGVPLYIFISANKPNDPVILNQILTTSHIADVINNNK